MTTITTHRLARRGLLLLALAPAAAACSDEGAVGGEDLRRVLLRSWGEDVLLPRYAASEAAAGELVQASRDLCAAPDASRLDAARAAWGRARRPWKETESFDFGPWADEPLRYGPKIDFWPARPDTIEGLIAGDGPLDAEAVAAFGSTGRGLPTLEILLWGLTDDPLADLQQRPRRCDLLVGASEDLQTQLGALRRAWAPEGDDFLGEVTRAGEGSTRYATLPDAFHDVVNRPGYLIENMRHDKLNRPLGSDAGGVPQPDLVESRASGRSLEDLRDNLRGFEALYFGPSDVPGATGLDDVVSRRAAWGAIMRQLLDDAYAALDAIPTSLAEAVVNDPDAVTALVAALTELQRTYQVDVLGALGLQVGFNDNDGD